MKSLVNLVALLPFALANLAVAQDDFFGDIDIVGDSDNASDNNWTLIGWARQKLNYGLQAPDPAFSRSGREWSKIETSAYARWDWQVGESTAVRISGRASTDAIYQVNGEENYSTEEINEFETRFDWLDIYVEAEFDNRWYVKAGQQVVVWGEAENLRIMDLVNTQDLFTFGQQDLENLRLPVPALRVNYPFKDVLVDAVFTYQAGRDDISPEADEFDPFIALRASGADLRIDRPDQESEYFLRLSGHYTHGDWSVMAAEANQNSLDARSLRINGPTIEEIRFDQDRFQALSASINWTAGSWLTFAETGLHMDKCLQPGTENLAQFTQGWLEKDQVLTALGLEYNGFRNLTVSAELDYIHTRDHDDQLAEDTRQTGYSARALWNGFNERVQVLAVWTQLPDQGGRVWRFTLDYDWSDSIELGLLWVSYHADQGARLYNYRNNDSVQLQFEYSFQR